jgi:hypothetical protein
VPVLVPIMAQLGMADEVFEVLETTFLGGTIQGTRFDPPGRLDQRPTLALFHPAVLALRGDPRFGRLLERTGLEDYWRKSGTRPDFRGG